MTRKTTGPALRYFDLFHFGLAVAAAITVGLLGLGFLEPGIFVVMVGGWACGAATAAALDRRAVRGVATRWENPVLMAPVLWTAAVLPACLLGFVFFAGGFNGGEVYDWVVKPAVWLLGAGVPLATMIGALWAIAGRVVVGQIRVGARPTRE
ncbi:MAG: hypothetical protein AAF721_31315 [Myxococcota bacterium]